MPIYEYQCESCSYRFEVKQSIKADPLATCERCGKALRRLISSPGIMFKGSGWYITDYSDKLKPPSGAGETTKTEEKKESASATASTTSSVSSTTPAVSASSPVSSPSTTSSP